MIQLSIINPHTIFTLFVRLKFVYAKSPFIGDFFAFQHPATTNTNTDHEVQTYLSYVETIGPLLGGVVVWRKAIRY